MKASPSNPVTKMAYVGKGAAELSPGCDGAPSQNYLLHKPVELGAIVYNNCKLPWEVSKGFKVWYLII